MTLSSNLFSYDLTDISCDGLKVEQCDFPMIAKN